MNTNPSLSFNLLSDLRELFTFPFMVNAIAAGTIVAVLAASVGWYVVLRRQAFASHTLAVMAFPGATAAALAGLPVAIGYYGACTLAALALGGAGRSWMRTRGGESAAIGTVQTVGLAAGFLFLSLNTSVLQEPESLLFGTFLGITRAEVFGLLVVAVVTLMTLSALARPLLFASIDPEIARASGVPVAALDVGFLVILGLAIAATSQLTGALLVFALLIAPPATAQLITMRPIAGLVLSIALALAVMWLALALAYFSVWPVGFYATTIAFCIYVAARVVRGVRGTRAVHVVRAVRG